jgi:hypothetical protein
MTTIFGQNAAGENGFSLFFHNMRARALDESKCCSKHYDEWMEDDFASSPQGILIWGALGTALLGAVGFAGTYGVSQYFSDEPTSVAVKFGLSIGAAIIPAYILFDAAIHASKATYNEISWPASSPPKPKI